MKTYELNGQLVCTEQRIAAKEVPFAEALASGRPLVRVFDAPPENHAGAFLAGHTTLAAVPEQGVHQFSLAKLDRLRPDAGNWQAVLARGPLPCVNRRWPEWETRLATPGVPCRRPAKVHLVALGNVGSTLLLALALLADGEISEIGVYDVDAAQAARWSAEINQCAWAFRARELPKVRSLTEEELFRDADVFVFAASAGVPEPGEERGDVRQMQYGRNSRIVGHYARLARERAFLGHFIVVSDPVERLCHAAFRASNLGPDGRFDSFGLRPEQIEGYGLGVMHSRGIDAAPGIEGCENYAEAGRAYGCHGEGLILANDPTHYNDAASQALTKAVVRANLNVRALGFKPYVAPAVSSGAMSLLAHLRGEWHYSAVFFDGCYFGCANRQREGLAEIECLPLDDALYVRLAIGVRRLKEIIADDGRRQ